MLKFCVYKKENQRNKIHKVIKIGFRQEIHLMEHQNSNIMWQKRIRKFHKWKFSYFLFVHRGQQHNIFFNLKYCTAGHSYTYVYCIKLCDKVPEMAITGVDCWNFVITRNSWFVLVGYYIQMYISFTICTPQKSFLS